MLVRVKGALRKPLRQVRVASYGLICLNLKPITHNSLRLLLVGALVFGLLGSCNPFAPTLSDVKIDRLALLGDRRTVKGFFEWFRNSYELRDTSLYGQILAPNFSFTFRDFANGNNEIWDRDTEMRIATNMFRQVRSTNLVWTWYVNADTSTTDTLASLERYFNLTVVADEQNVYMGTGTARLTLVRADSTHPWRIKSWVDIRDF